MKMSHDQPPELFSPERPVRSDFARANPGIPYAVRRVITLAVLAAVLIGGGVWAWDHFFASATGEVPTIKADGSYKQRPDQPGGIDIPHQDVQVYHEIDGSASGEVAKPQVEHMLPLPEQPNPAAMVPQQAGVDTDKTGQMESLIDKVAPPPVIAPVPEAVAPAPIVQAPIDVPTPPPVAVIPAPVPMQEVKEVPAPPVAATPKAAPVAKGNVAIQLAATQDEPAAHTKAQDLQDKYASVLGSAKLRIVRADLGAKGIFYRIQSQPMSEAQATNICSAIKNAHGGCILVRH